MASKLISEYSRLKQFKYSWMNPITKEVETFNPSSSIIDTKIDEREAGIVKLGIQAPPGTKFEITLMNETEPFEIVVGRSGLYELEYEDILISTVTILPAANTKRDTERENDLIDAGVTLMTTAANDLKNAKASSELSEISNWVNSLINGYNKFVTGKRGVYREVDNVLQPKNILIDYIVKEVD